MIRIHRTTRLLLVTASAVTAVAALTFAGVAASGASTGKTLPTLNPPNLHAPTAIGAPASSPATMLAAAAEGVSMRPLT